MRDCNMSLHHYGPSISTEPISFNMVDLSVKAIGIPKDSYKKNKKQICIEIQLFKVPLRLRNCIVAFNCFLFRRGIKMR